MPNGRTSTDLEEVTGEIKVSAEDTVKKGRKSINKALQRVSDTVDASKIALPESPVPAYASLSGEGPFTDY
jgi:hypothetical protein